MDIKFIFSPQFQTSLTDREVLYPAKEIDVLTKFWQKHGEEIEKTLTRITGLSFAEQSIKCYLNSEFSVSDPLCIKVEDIESMIDSIIHELIHILYIQNEDKIDSAWKALVAEYKDESPTTRIHLIVHRVHYLVAQKFFPERLEKIMTFSKRDDYVRSWEILKNPEKVDKLLGLSANIELANS